VLTRWFLFDRMSNIIKERIEEDKIMIIITEDISNWLSVETCGWGDCSDSCGDEDNCCEYGCDRMPGLVTLTVEDLL